MPQTGSAVNADVATDERVQHYRENGWVKLPGLVDASVAAEIRQHLDEAASPSRNLAFPKDAQVSFEFYRLPSDNCDVLHGVSRSAEMAKVAMRLMGYDRVRFWLDSGLIKAPVSAGGTDTPWHQDFPTQPFDRAGGLQIWIALEEMQGEMGTLQYMNGSHRWGPLGRTQLLPSGTSVLDLYPHLAEYTVSDAPDMKPGDALVHDSLTVHTAGPNRSDKKRWAYTSAWMRADTIFTGAPSQFSEGYGLEANKEFDHPRYTLYSMAELD